MALVGFPSRVMHRFVEALSSEIGRDTYHAVKSKSGLSRECRLPEFFLAMDGSQTAEAYSKLQGALRIYYRRGARGILMRIGAKLWEPILNDAPFCSKARPALVRGVPKPLKRKPALEPLAGNFGAEPGDISVHTLDLLLVDKASPTTLGQKDDSPVCIVKFGLIRECLYWATGKEHDIKERACRAVGAERRNQYGAFILKGSGICYAQRLSNVGT